MSFTEKEIKSKFKALMSIFPDEGIKAEDLLIFFVRHQDWRKSAIQKPATLLWLTPSPTSPRPTPLRRTL